MALSERHRSTIYQRLAPILGEEEAEALVSQFPARDLDVPATKEFVGSEIAATREFVQGEIAATKEFVRAEIAELEVRLDDKLTGMTLWTIGTVVGVGAAVIAAVGLWG